MDVILDEYADSVEVAERALDYSYNVDSNYLRHEGMERNNDFRSAGDFLKVGLAAICSIPKYFSYVQLSDVLRALGREIGGVENRLRCFEMSKVSFL